MKDYIKLTIEGYNLTAEDYFNRIKAFGHLPELIKFSQLVRLPGLILDLGCGPGLHSKYLYEKGHNVIGVDLSESMIKIAKNLEPSVKFYIKDIRHLTFKTDRFDAIWASASLIHLKKSEIRDTLLNLGRMVKPNGIIYISLKEGTGEEIAPDIRYRNVKRFSSFFQKSEIENILHEIEFRIIDIYVRDKRPDYDTNPWIHMFLNPNKSLEL